MSKVKIELDHNAVAAFLCSAPVENMVKAMLTEPFNVLARGIKRILSHGQDTRKCARKGRYRQG